MVDFQPKSTIRHRQGETEGAVAGETGGGAPICRSCACLLDRSRNEPPRSAAGLGHCIATDDPRLKEKYITRFIGPYSFQIALRNRARSRYWQGMNFLPAREKSSRAQKTLVVPLSQA